MPIPTHKATVFTTPSSHLPFPLDEIAAERPAKRYHASPLDFKTASCGDLQAALGPIEGMAVFQTVDAHIGQLGSVTATLKKAARAWGFDIFPNRDRDECSIPRAAGSPRWVRAGRVWGRGRYRAWGHGRGHGQGPGLRVCS